MMPHLHFAQVQERRNASFCMSHLAFETYMCKYICSSKLSLAWYTGSTFSLAAQGQFGGGGGGNAQGPKGHVSVLLRTGFKLVNLVTGGRFH